MEPVENIWKCDWLTGRQKEQEVHRSKIRFNF